MKQRCTFFLIGIIGSIVAGNATILQAAEEGFVPLFPGDSIEGFKVSDWSNVAAPQKVEGTPWKVENGVLYGLNKRTWIRSVKQYGDFVLKLDTKVTRGSNGGIGLRFPPEGDPAYTAMEIQVVDDRVYYGGSARTEQCTVSIYDEIDTSKVATNPVGQWNSLVITARGIQITIVLNG